MKYHKIILLVGRKRCGKTTFASKMLQNRKRVLVVDTFDHPGYREYRPVPGALIANIKQGKYRTFDSHPIQSLEAIFTTMYDCTIVMEDAVKYLEANVPKQIKDKPDESYTLTDFRKEEENPHFGGGKKENRMDQDDEEEGSGQPRGVQCQNQ